MAAVPSRFQPLVEATAAVARRFSDAGHELHLVGGPVRAPLLGLDPKASADLDYATDARPEKILGPGAGAEWSRRGGGSEGPTFRYVRQPPHPPWHKQRDR